MENVGCGIQESWLEAGRLRSRQGGEFPSDTGLDAERGEQEKARDANVAAVGEDFGGGAFAGAGGTAEPEVVTGWRRHGWLRS